jgi:hypothetical protein
LDQHGLRKKIITCLKDDRLNLNAMTSALIYVVSCEVLKMYLKVSKGLCFGYVFFKACQYATKYEKNCKGFKYVSMKFA